MTLEEALEVSAALEERASRAKTAAERDGLLRRQASADVVAFERFKEANGQALQMASKFVTPLAWGVGLGLPALGVGHLLLRDARHQGQQLVRDARNQALLTAAGLGGAKSLVDVIQGAMRKTPTQREELEEMTLPGQGTMSGRRVVKLSEDEALKKLAAALLVDEALVDALPSLNGEEKTAAEACLVLNRMHGVSLLRKLAR